MSPQPHALLLAGASGLVGREALRLALAMPSLRRVHALVRRPLQPAPHDDRLQLLTVDFSQLGRLPTADAALCALGTTLEAAGSQAAFRAVDLDAVVAFAKAARAAGVQRFGTVSALGADVASAVFYNRVKGEAEAALRTLGFEVLVIARPSLLLGDRQSLGQPARAGERLGQLVARPLGALIPLAWRPIAARRVARALLRTLVGAPPGVHVLESARLQESGQP